MIDNMHFARCDKKYNDYLHHVQSSRQPLETISMTDDYELSSGVWKAFYKSVC